MEQEADGTSKNVLERTWLAYAWDRPIAADELHRRLGRVQAHYQRTITDPLEFRSDSVAGLGLALWTRPDGRLRWPLWSATGARSCAWAGVPTGWEALTGREPSPARAAERLAAQLASAPELSMKLNPPFLFGLLDRDGDRDRGALTLAADALGVNRLYELRTREGHVWSNRLGALHLFAGEEPRPDDRAWRVFAAAGWFLGGATAIAGAEKVAPGTVVEATGGDGARTAVEHVPTGARGELVMPRRARLGDSAAAAAEAAAGLARNISQAWDAELAIALTGGRDSRISAAATLAADVGATYNTGDQVPGELEVVRELIAKAPRPMPHEVHRPEAEDEPEDNLIDRARGHHLMHDGMRNPQEVRRSLSLPHARRLQPNMSGHGGELGHGFYYANRKQLARLRKGGDDGMMARLEAAARRRHSAAVPSGYQAYVEECRKTLDEGRAHGVRGPALLDWFYLAQRLSYRSGLGSRESRYSACVTPAFVRGCFDLKPKDRLSAKLHREVVARLVPEWRKVGFFSSGSAPMPEIHRRRIWERPREAAVLDEVIAGDGDWAEVFEPDTIRRMWAQVRRGEGTADYEHVFYRVVWCEAFSHHRRELAAAATG
ncbi:MAG: hypothetical protein ACR2G3_08605 [Solirubrobacterales bacterium]